MYSKEDVFSKDIEDVLCAITSKVIDGKELVNDITLAGGLSGLVVFLSNFNVFKASTNLDNKIDLIFQEIFQVVQTRQFLPSLHSGISGIGWLVDYLQFRNSKDKAQTFEDYNEEIDLYILNLLSDEKWHGEYELMLGLVGIAVYGLQCANIATRRQIAEKSIIHLLKIAKEDNNGCYWLTESYSRYHSKKGVEPEINLGLAHGMPGVIGLLSYAVRKNVLVPNITPYLLKACEWTLKQKNPSSLSSYFPYKHNAYSTSRLAWCYGDLSTAYVLYRAGMAINNNSIMRQALSIGIHTCGRRIEESSVVDAGFCHGSSGLMFIYFQFHRYSDEALFSESFQYWLKKTLNFANSNSNLTGLDRYNGHEKKYDECFGLVEGLAGIGLSLLAVTTDSEPDWADIFLLG
ncbi:lanthionine synthetase C family protein [Flavobacterium sp. W21_SRS_FM6]|uniref:lanthionine synthetase C family protein n=1 Tax=Flavobacterium sp. W21_SRS_FM6 TaxID=3240268 RepID=UPI003F932ABA